MAPHKSFVLSPLTNVAIHNDCSMSLATHSALRPYRINLRDKALAANVLRTAADSAEAPL